jgi:signal transduction histidine kinase
MEFIQNGNVLPAITVFLQMAFPVLFCAGMFLILTELSANFDRSFLFAGFLLVTFSVLIGLTLWINPKPVSPKEMLNSVRIFHFVGCLLVPLFIYYLLIITKSNKLVLFKLTILFTFILILSNYSDYVLTIKNGQVVDGFLYRIMYCSMAIYLLVVSVMLVINSLKVSHGEYKRMLKIHLVGVLTLLPPATLSTFFTPPSAYISSLSSDNLLLFLGCSIFGIIVAFIFIQRFVLLNKDRQVAFEKLETAYTELDQANSLKEIGQSTAIINHEIKNFTFGISGNVQLILDYDKNISEPTKNKLTAIIETTKRMSDFSMDILELSKAKIIKEKVEISVYGVMQRCIENHFAAKKRFFSFSGFEQDPLIHGDWNKLDHVFVNVFKNAFEAEATLIRIKAIKSPTVLLLTIDDDGIGCDEKAFKQIFTAFYTTKKNSRGTGLGMPIIKSIVESHGGYISAYSKNLMEGGDHGLVLNVSFPTYSQPNTQTDIPKQNIVLVKEGIENIGPVIRVFQNVHFTPRIVQSLSDVDGREFSMGKMMVLANPENIVKMPMYLAHTA